MAPAPPGRSCTQRIGMSALVFGCPGLLILWGVLAVLGTPLLLETVFLIGPLMVAWALTLVLLRDRVRRSGVLGTRVAQ